MTPERCPLLASLPVELRLIIYNYAILDSRTITIGTAKLDGQPADIIHRLYGSNRSPYPGIPQNHEPVVETRYQPSLLNNSALIPLTPFNLESSNDFDHTHAAYHTLRLLCRQVNNELTTHFAIPTLRQTSLFLHYPHGLTVLNTRLPGLLCQARSVHLAGTYLSKTFCPVRAACMGPRSLAPQEKLQGDYTPDSKSQLERLLSSMFGKNPTLPVEKLEMRIYYPGDDSYSTVWGCDGSPTVIALSCVQYGNVDIEIWRGRYGTGVYLAARSTGEKKRVVSTVWRRFDEGRRGQPDRSSWIVDPNWPNWSPEYQRSEGGPGDRMTSVG